MAEIAHSGIFILSVSAHILAKKCTTLTFVWLLSLQQKKYFMNNKKIKNVKKSASVPHLIDERLELLNTIEEMVKKEVKRQTKDKTSSPKQLSGDPS